MNLKAFKTSLILGLGTSIGANVVLAVFLVGVVSSPVLFPSEDYCDIEKEFLKIKSQYGIRYYDLSLEQQTAFDNDFNELQDLMQAVNTTQEEFDFHYEGLLDTYGIEPFYSDEEIRSMFWGWIKMCE